MTMMEFVKRGALESSLKKDITVPPKHIYEHTVQVKWGPDGGPAKDAASAAKR